MGLPWQRGPVLGFGTKRPSPAGLPSCRANYRIRLSRQRQPGYPFERLSRPASQADSAASEPDRWRMGHTWDAAQPSIDATSVAAGHGTQTNLNRGGLQSRRREHHR